MLRPIQTLAAALGLALMGIGAACTKDEAPADPMEFRAYLTKTMGGVLAQTTCQCCGKSLLQCYDETLQQAGNACPVQCATCLIEGRVALELKRQGQSDAEIARRTLAVIMGQEPPPPGIDINQPLGHPHQGHDHQGHQH